MLKELPPKERKTKKMGWKLWLDDQIDDPSCPARHPPEGFTGAKTVYEASVLISNLGMPDFMDLDHDLGDDQPNGMGLCRWITSYDLGAPVVTRPIRFRIHSANPVGKANMESILNSFNKVFFEENS